MPDVDAASFAGSWANTGTSRKHEGRSTRNSQTTPKTPPRAKARATKMKRAEKGPPSLMRKSVRIALRFVIPEHCHFQKVSLGIMYGSFMTIVGVLGLFYTYLTDAR